MLGYSASVTLTLMGAAFCALVYLWICARQDKPWLHAVVKAASVGLLAVAAFQASPLMLLPAALVACAVGDFFLAREGDEAFVTGVGAFAFGHLAYAALFLLHPASDMMRIGDGWPLVLALVLLGLVMILLLYSKAGALRWAVLAYVPIIVVMGVMSIAITPTGALALVLPAALLFIFSDFVFSQEMLVLREGHPLRRYTPYVIWASYWGAQLMFVLAFTAQV